MEFCGLFQKWFDNAIIDEDNTTEKDDKQKIPWDIIVNDGNYVIICELPGAVDISVNVMMDNLILSCSHELPFRSQFLVRERVSKSTSRSFKLPVDSVTDKIYSEFNNGILVIRIPRKPIFNVQITSGSSNGLKWE